MRLSLARIGHLRRRGVRDRVCQRNEAWLQQRLRTLKQQRHHRRMDLSSLNLSESINRLQSMLCHASIHNSRSDSNVTKRFLF